MTDKVEFEQKDEDHALGPHYFSARKFSEKLMSSEEWRELKKPIDKMALDFYDTVKDIVENSLQSDIEGNIQNHVWLTVDEIVREILGKKRWAMQRYVLGNRYDCDQIRSVIAKHCQNEVLELRIKDLETENERLKADLRFYREHR